MDKDNWRPLVPSDYTLREPTGARKKTETLRATQKETGEPSKSSKEKRRQKVGTLREPSTPSQTEAVPQGLLSKDFSDFWKWRSSREVNRGPKGITKPKVLLQPQRPAYGPPDKFYMSDEPSYYDYYFLRKFLKEEKNRRRAEENKMSEFIAQEMAKARINEKKALFKGTEHTPKEKVKKKRNGVGAYSVNYSKTGQTRQQLSSGMGSGITSGYTSTSTIDMPCRCDAWRDKDTAPGWHCQSDRCKYQSTEDTQATEASVTEEEGEHTDPTELTPKEIERIHLEETDKYMRRKMHYLTSVYKMPMSLVKRLNEDKVAPWEDEAIDQMVKDRVKRENKKRTRKAKERVIFKGPRYYEGPTLSYESDNQYTSENDSEEETDEDSPEITEAETTEGETDGETTYEDETEAETTYETEEETEAETETETPYEETEAETSEAETSADPDTEASATEASEASASEADYSGYES